MPAVKPDRRTKIKRSAGQNRPGDLSRFIAQGLRSSETSPKKGRFENQKQNPLRLLSTVHLRGSFADAFFGASPVVASALGIRSGATPRGQIHSKPTPSALRRKEDISTLLGIGHFYFALTARRSCPSPG